MTGSVQQKTEWKTTIIKIISTIINYIMLDNNNILLVTEIILHKNYFRSIC